MTAQVRRFRMNDRPELVVAIDAVCGEGVWMCTPRFEPDACWEHALTAGACPGHLLLVAEDEHCVVGWCRLFPAQTDSHTARQAELGIGLLPAYRDQGIGTDMLRRSLQWAQNMGLARVTLTARQDNQRALHVFGHCGFRPVETLETGEVRLAWETRLSAWPKTGTAGDESQGPG